MIVSSVHNYVRFHIYKGWEEIKMNPDSTFMSDMTGTRDKGVGTRAEGTGRQGFRIQEEKSRQPLFGLFCLSGLFGLSGRTAARQ